MNGPKKLPTHVLSVKQKRGDRKTPRIGVGWLNADGSISISLNPCVVLTSKDDVFVTLFPIDYAAGEPWKPEGS
jgi:hypothetical protein